jgi:hypothetical protein
MKKYFAFILIPIAGFGFLGYGNAVQSHKASTTDLKIVFIRHGEKPEKGSNLTCKGLNRSLMLPALIKQKFGVPDFVYVPALKSAEKTGRSRMFETAVPLATKYNLDIDSKFEEDDSAGVANDVMQKKGTVLVIWEHKAINPIIHALGIQYNTKWGGDDYDSIIIITFKDGKATVTTDKEGLNPSDDCPN